jgi:hypothetical protein
MAAAFSRDASTNARAVMARTPIQTTFPTTVVAAHLPVGSVARRAPDDDWESAELKLPDCKSPHPSAFRFLKAGLSRGQPTGRTGGSLPPAIQTTPKISHRFRFVSTSASILPVTVTELVGIVGAIGTVANTTVATLASSVKLRKVIVWPSASTSAPSSPELYWANAINTNVPDEVRERSLPQGVSVTGSLEFVPPPMSLAGFWNSDQAIALFDASFPIGSVIDVILDVRLSNALPNANISVATAALGTLYYLALDGAASNKWTPVGLPTTH